VRAFKTEKLIIRNVHTFKRINVKEVIEMMDNKPWEELNKEIAQLCEQYARLKNKPKPFETETEKEARKAQLEKDKREKREKFDSFKADFGKKRDYVLGLRKEVEDLRMRARKDELEQKLKEQTITEKELLELQALNKYLQVKT